MVFPMSMETKREKTPMKNTLLLEKMGQKR
jgi:hypothetical protein